ASESSSSSTQIKKLAIIPVVGEVSAITKKEERGSDSTTADATAKPSSSVLSRRKLVPSNTVRVVGAGIGYHEQKSKEIVETVKERCEGIVDFVLTASAIHIKFNSPESAKIASDRIVSELGFTTEYTSDFQNIKKLANAKGLRKVKSVLESLTGSQASEQDGSSKQSVSETQSNKIEDGSLNSISQESGGKFLERNGQSEGNSNNAGGQSSNRYESRRNYQSDYQQAPPSSFRAGNGRLPNFDSLLRQQQQVRRPLSTGGNFPNNNRFSSYCGNSGGGGRPQSWNNGPPSVFVPIKEWHELPPEYGTIPKKKPARKNYATRGGVLEGGPSDDDADDQNYNEKEEPSERGDGSGAGGGYGVNGGGGGRGYYDNRRLSSSGSNFGNKAHDAGQQQQRHRLPSTGAPVTERGASPEKKQAPNKDAKSSSVERPENELKVDEKGQEFPKNKQKPIEQKLGARSSKSELEKQEKSQQQVQSSTISGVELPDDEWAVQEPRQQQRPVEQKPNARSSKSELGKQEQKTQKQPVQNSTVPGVELPNDEWSVSDVPRRNEAQQKEQQKHPQKSGRNGTAPSGNLPKNEREDSHSNTQQVSTNHPQKQYYQNSRGENGHVSSRNNGRGRSDGNGWNNGGSQQHPQFQQRRDNDGSFRGNAQPTPRFENKPTAAVRMDHYSKVATLGPLVVNNNDSGRTNAPSDKAQSQNQSQPQNKQQKKIIVLPAVDLPDDEWGSTKNVPDAVVEPSHQEQQQNYQQHQQHNHQHHQNRQRYSSSENESSYDPNQNKRERTYSGGRGGRSYNQNDHQQGTQRQYQRNPNNQNSVQDSGVNNERGNTMKMPQNEFNGVGARVTGRSCVAVSGTVALLTDGRCAAVIPLGATTHSHSHLNSQSIDEPRSSDAADISAVGLVHTTATGRILAAVARGRDVRVYCTDAKSTPENQNSGTSVWLPVTSLQHSGDVTCIDWSPNGRMLLATGDFFSLWAVKSENLGSPTQLSESSNTSFELLWSIPAPSPVSKAKFSPDGSLFASIGLNDRFVKIWHQSPTIDSNIANDINQKNVLTHNPPEFSSSNQLSSILPINALLTVSNDSIARIWCQTSNQLQSHVESHFSSDGTNISTAEMGSSSNIASSAAIIENIPTSSLNSKEIKQHYQNVLFELRASILPDLTGNGGISTTSIHWIQGDAMAQAIESTLVHENARNSKSGFDGKKKSNSKSPAAARAIKDYPDMLFAVGETGSVVVWGVQGLDGNPQRVPKVVVVLKTENGVLSGDFEAFLGDTHVFYNPSVVSNSAIYFPPQISILAHSYISGLLNSYTMNLDEFFGSTWSNPYLRLEHSWCGHTEPIIRFSRHPNSSIFASISINSDINIYRMSVPQDAIRVTDGLDLIAHYNFETEISTELLVEWIPNSNLAIVSNGRSVSVYEILSSNVKRIASLQGPTAMSPITFLSILHDDYLECPPGNISHLVLALLLDTTFSGIDSSITNIVATNSLVAVFSPHTSLGTHSFLTAEKSGICKLWGIECETQHIWKIFQAGEFDIGGGNIPEIISMKADMFGSLVIDLNSTKY
ncbi:DmX-like protein 1, partial [Physocladia obscura]